MNMLIVISRIFCLELLDNLRIAVCLSICMFALPDSTSPTDYPLLLVLSYIILLF